VKYSTVVQQQQQTVSSKVAVENVVVVEKQTYCDYIVKTIMKGTGVKLALVCVFGAGGGGYLPRPFSKQHGRNNYKGTKP
jgi:hypothetical protein